MGTFLNTIALLILFILSAFWSGSETALTSLSKYKIRKLTALHKALAGPLGEWLKSPYYLLTFILVGNTLTNLVLSSIATVLALEVLPFLPRALVEFLVWLLVTLILLVFCEVTPKIFARGNAEKVTLFTLPILNRLVSGIRVLAAPFSRVLKRLFPADVGQVPISRLSYLTVEEVRSLITEADTSGVLGAETSQMLKRVVSLGEMSVSKIMTPASKVDYVTMGYPEEKFLDLLVETGRSRVPVFNPALKKFTGFVHTKDLLWAWKSNNGHFSENLVRPPYFISPDKKIYDLLKEFQSGKTHEAFVVDAFGSFLGLVTLEDVLEEIVGEILDEYDLKDIEDEAGAGGAAGTQGRKA